MVNLNLGEFSKGGSCEPAYIKFNSAMVDRNMLVGSDWIDWNLLGRWEKRRRIQAIHEFTVVHFSHVSVCTLINALRPARQASHT